MISNRWIETRRQSWNRLEILVQQVESSGLKSLAAADLREFGLLYRQTASDLSAVRADRASRTIEAYLNQLLGRAHNYIYAGKRLSLTSVWQFFAQDYPRLFRKLLPYTAVALMLFVGGALLGALTAMARPRFAQALLGPAMMNTIEHHKMWTESILSAKPQASSFIMTNNISVCFMTFASGIAAGIGTLYLLFENGMMMGVVSATCAQHGMALSLWSFVASHGALELPSIFISGAAGLRLAVGLLFPGTLLRKDALAVAGSDAIRLLAGTIPLLVIAGLLEGFLSPTHVPLALKFSVCAALLTGLGLWLGEGGRHTPATGLAPTGKSGQER
ncbi:membrane protein [Edaphobacter acidisoli]|uniref:Membrane protein n=2 Tax=Edaphobacter acidisoli TaxID=2040573 RepID=A0A916RW53_9BACT|nr:stage II sporulation protein M [Edaphobacter acidisoli]GGA73145.1 membrane protein [Edaphobacter acidisoli]